MLNTFQEGGTNSLSAEPSSTRALYQCWFGLELEPSDSEIRYCIQGKWSGKNPRCGIQTYILDSHLKFDLFIHIFNVILSIAHNKIFILFLISAGRM